MLSGWPIRRKLTLCLTLLIVAVVTLAWSGNTAIYKYRAVARGLSRRSLELPLASGFAHEVADLRVTFSRATQTESWKLLESVTSEENEHEQALEDLRTQLVAARESIHRYKTVLQRNQRIEDRDWRADENVSEAQTLHKIELELDRVSNYVDTPYLVDLPEVCVAEIVKSLTKLQTLSTELPSYLTDRMKTFKDDVQGEYRRSFFVMGIASVLTLIMLSLLVRLLYLWILKPFRQMLHGSRRVARGDFDHRILLASKDEMAELATAMNDMTRRFQEIRDDLDEQVRVRTQEAVRGEQLASVGFLAAGVAHEINNPLQSIALCAESLEDRLHDIIADDDVLADDEHNDEIMVCRNYLRMIQDEAFRCKGITSGLLDFARVGNRERQATDLVELANGVLSLVGHLERHKDKKLRCEATGPVWAHVNAQEMKQVVLNVITNALDSLEQSGEVVVRLREVGDRAELQVVDNGCGMDADTLRHLYEPFFTRRRDGQGTGLGMSITHRIVTDHGGTIRAESQGVGTGSKFTISLPLANRSEKESYYYKAA